MRDMNKVIRNLKRLIALSTDRMMSHTVENEPEMALTCLVRVRLLNKVLSELEAN